MGGGLARDVGAGPALSGHPAACARGRTLVGVTHKSSMLALVDRVVVLEAGKVVADGPREEVLRALSQGAAGPPAATKGRGA